MSKTSNKGVIVRWMVMVWVLLFSSVALVPSAAMASNRDTQHVQYWIQIVRSHPKQMYRKNAARMLGSMGDRTATPALIEALRDPFFGVRVEAAYALGILTDQTALAALMETASKDSDALVRRKAREAIRKINAHQEFVQKKRDQLTK